jgi:hypothetical protein
MIHMIQELSARAPSDFTNRRIIVRGKLVSRGRAKRRWRLKRGKPYLNPTNSSS